MNLITLCIGKTDEKPLEELILKYEKRLPQHWNYQRIEIPDIKNRKNLSEQQQKDKEAELILAKLQPTDYVILLDESGKQMSSAKFAEEIRQLMNQSVKQIVFLIGGPYGFSDEVYKRANRRLSFSQTTITHQMIRLFLPEQIYHPLTILPRKAKPHT